MSKRVLMAGLAIGVGLATLQTGTAEAQWQFALPPGMWWYYGSVDGCATITKVPNPETHPAILRCNVALTRIETLCENPQNKSVSPGEAATQVMLFDTIDPSDLLEKEKGKANICVGVNEVEDLGAEVLCVNGNWNPVAALTTEFRATCTTEKCTGEDDPNTPEDDTCEQTVVKDTQVCACTLPAQYSLENYPENLPDPCPDPLHPTDNCVAYICKALDPKTGAVIGECTLELQ